MSTKFDARQSVVHDTLNQLTGAANSELDNIAVATNDQLAKLYIDKNIQLVDGGILSYTSGAPSNLTLTATLKLKLNSTIAGTTVTKTITGTSFDFSADGRMLYVILDNRTSDSTLSGANVVADAASLPTVTSGNLEVFLIAKRVDGATQRVYLRNGQSLGNGESSSLGSAAVTPSFSDASFEIYDNTTPTKKIKFEASGLTGTNTFTPPPATDTLAGIGTAQTWTAIQSMSAQFRISDGSVSEPSIVFINDDDTTGTGLYRVAANSMGFTANGINIGQYSSSGAWTFGPSSGLTSSHLFQNNAPADYALTIYNQDISSTAAGLKIRAGTSNAAQSILSVANASNSINYFYVRGDGASIWNNSSGTETGSVNSSGQWVLGPDGSSVLHTIKGQLTVQSAQSGGTSTFLFKNTGTDPSSASLQIASARTGSGVGPSLQLLSGAAGTTVYWSLRTSGDGELQLASASVTVYTASQAGVVSFVSAPIFSALTASTVPYLDASKVLTSSAVTPTELGYVSGVTSAIQTQLNAKAPLASPTFTGTVTLDILNATGVPVFSGSNFRIAASSGGLGNATNPYLTPSDDTNSGIFFTGADAFGISAGGVQNIAFTSTGMVTLGASYGANQYHTIQGGGIAITNGGGAVGVGSNLNYDGPRNFNRLSTATNGGAIVFDGNASASSSAISFFVQPPGGSIGGTTGTISVGQITGQGAFVLGPSTGAGSNTNIHYAGTHRFRIDSTSKYLDITNDSSNNYIDASHTLYIRTNTATSAVNAAIASTTGSWTFGAASGTTGTHTIQSQATANYATLILNSNSVNGQSSGLRVSAGAGSSDTSFVVTNYNNTSNYLTVNGAGACTFGPSSGSAILHKFQSGDATELRISSTGSNKNAYISFAPTGTGAARLLITSGSFVVSDASDVAILTGTQAGVWEVGPTSGGGGVKFNNSTGSYTPTLLDYYEEGSFTLTATGMTTSPTGTAYFVRIGKVVTINIPAISGTSNANTFTLTGVPARLQPSRVVIFQLRFTDNGTVLDFIGLGVINTSSDTITCYKSPASASVAWSASGTKAVSDIMVSYTLN